jgi:hypothetical protein
MKETAAPAAVADLPIDPALPRTSTAPRTKPGPRPNWICGFGRSLKVGRTAALRNASRGAPTRRNARIKLAMVLREKFGRYGDPAAPAPYGVETVAREFYTPEHMEHMGGRASLDRSVRAEGLADRSCSARPAEFYCGSDAVRYALDSCQ